MSRNELRALLASDPAAFLRLLEPDALPPAEQTFAAEYARDCPGAEPLLRRLFFSRHSVVREGALLGLSDAVEVETLRCVQALAVSDPSPAIRECAREWLDARGGD